MQTAGSRPRTSDSVHLEMGGRVGISDRFTEDSAGPDCETPEISQVKLGFLLLAGEKGCD